MADYLLGLDGGTQSTKVTVFDLQGRVRAEAKVDLRPLLLPAPGVVLHPDDDLWDSLKAACARVLAAFDGKPSDIKAVGLCSIRCCRVLLKEDGSLAYPVLSWMDDRLARPYDPGEVPGVRYVTTTTGYLARRLTGRNRDTAANYEGQWPLDKATWQWSEDPEVLRRCRIPREMLFDLVNPGEILGDLAGPAAEALGLPAGIPVVATANDKAVEALGSGALGPDTALVSLGTYITSMMEGPSYVPEAESFFTNLACVPGRYIYESGGIRRGMSTVSWIRDLLGGDVRRAAAELGLSPEDYLNREAAKLPAGSEGLITLPEWLAPPSAPYKRGAMLGFDGRHTGVHMYRSILEAIALTLSNHTWALVRELGTELKRLVISGGGAGGDLFMQIFADVYGLPASRNEISGAVGLGAAMCAAVALGVYPDFGQAAGAMVRPRDTFRPDPARTALYREMNERVYRRLTDHTDEILKLLHPLGL